MEPTPQPKIPTWKNLGVRALSAIILVGICFLPLLMGGLVWAVLVMLLASRLIWEWVRMADATPSGAAYAVPIIGLIIGITYVYLENMPMAWVAIALTAALAVAERARRGGGLWAGLGFLYVAVPSLMIMALRGNDPGLTASGFLLMAFLIVVVGAADTGAYFGGSYFKGPKMAPKLSPKKTWSGFCSGFIFAVLLGALVGWIIGLSPLTGTLLAMPVIVFSVIGDFLESGLKRRLQVKDAGNLLPGHGGLLDRLDSLMMVVFVTAVSLFVWPELWPI